MRTITFNKHKILCLTCRKNPVKRYTQSCDDCKKKRSEQSFNPEVVIARKQPAAVVTTEDGATVFVDKHGRQVKDHGYDLENDPRGYVRSGQIAKKTKTIL